MGGLSFHIKKTFLSEIVPSKCLKRKEKKFQIIVFFLTQLSKKPIDEYFVNYKKDQIQGRYVTEITV